MSRAVLCAPLALLLIAAAPTIAQKTAGGGGGGGERVVSVSEGAPLTVECRLRVEQRAEWRLEGRAPPADMAPRADQAQGQQLVARLHADAARAHHAGLYTCAPGAQPVRVRLATSADRAAATTAAADAAAAVEAIGAAAATTAEGATLQYFELPRELRIKCGLNNPPAEGYLWKKNDTDVRQLAELKERFRIENNNEEFVLPPRTAEDDAGLYSCSAAGQTRVFEIRGNPVVKLAPNSNVVEGQKLKLACRVIGKPHPALEWLYYNGTQWGALEDARFAAGADGSLTAAAAERGDAGEYMCRAVLPADSAHLQHLVPSNATTTLRVKDMYAALWPFLGICAEVFILCAIILVYEKRRTKPELDDSDTDNHDQKKS